MAVFRERPTGFRDALKMARELLGASPELVLKGSIDAEAEILVLSAFRAATGRALSRLDFYSRLGDRYPDEAGDRLLVLAGARAEGRPLQHLTGMQAFVEHEYEVGADVLIPRPETEILVMRALEVLRQAGRIESILGVEVGLGSGAISVELLAALPGLSMLGSELTDEAAQRAASNAGRILGADASRLRILRPSGALDVLEPFFAFLGESGRKADFIISNPPYLTTWDPIEGEVLRHEPWTALFAPAEDALHFYRAVAASAVRCLRPGGWVFMEIPPERAAQILDLYAPPQWDASIFQDLTGRDRVLVATFSGKG